MRSLQDDTLFWIFYTDVRDPKQEMAAHELFVPLPETKEYSVN